MHPSHTLGNRGPKYPSLKRSPCDLNNGGPKRKNHKAYFDQILKRSENIGTMRGGGVMNDRNDVLVLFL